MTLTLDLPPDVKRQLETRAQQQGVTLADYAANVLEREVEKNAKIAERLAILDAFEADAREFSKGAPPLSDEAVSRAAFYEEQDIASDHVNRRLAALRDVIETARGFANSPDALKAPLSAVALSRAGAYESAE